MRNFSLFFIIPYVFSAFIQFTPLTNPNEATVSLPVPTEWFPSYQKIYTVEFWVRPYLPKSLGSYLLMQNPTDWYVYYVVPGKTIKISYFSRVYCEFDNVNHGNWHHIAISYDFYLPQVSCYLNGTLWSESTVSAVAKYPSKLLIGHNFTGNIAEIRVWVNEVRTPSMIFQYFASWYMEPFPSTLKRLFRLVQAPGDSIIDQINLETVKIPTAFKSPFLQENPESLQLCGSGSFKSGSLCTSCAAPCKFCSSISACFETKSVYLDFSRSGYSTDIISLTNIQSSLVSTIELWFKSTDWSKSSSELIKLSNFFRLYQKPFSPLLTLQDGLNTEVHSFKVENQKWEHLSWVYSADKVFIYINQNLNFATWRNSSGTSLVIGGSSASLRFTGILFDLRLWKVFRASWQIFSNFYTVLPLTPDLYRHFRLNDTGSSIKSSDSLSSSSKTLIASLWRTLNCTQESCIWPCTYQYYSDAVGECKKCHWTCQACTGPLDNDCSVCLPTDYKILGLKNCYKTCPGNMVAQGFMCTEKCDTGYFNENSYCTLCNTPCTECESKTNCQKCIEGFKVYNGICQKICPTGQYRINDNVCSNCHQSCLECSSGLDGSCTECKSGVLYKGRCLEKCPNFTYLIEKQCFDCDVSCKTCSGPLNTQCLACNEKFLYRDLQGICYSECENFTFDSLCLENCPLGYYADNRKYCEKCDDTCNECLGPGPNSCKSCDFYLFQQTCYTSCPDTTFASGSTCEYCEVSCKKCENSQNCILCAEGFNYRLNNKCVKQCPKFSFYDKCTDNCPFGYLNVGANCEACQGNCTTCQGNLEKCTSCPSDLVLFEGKCVEKCPGNSFLEGSACVLCKYPCEKCEKSENFCLGCLDGLKNEVKHGKCVDYCEVGTFLLETMCLEQCPNEYFIAGSICSRCEDGCSLCLSLLECLKCAEGYFYYNKTCIKSCPASYYTGLKTMKCEACSKVCFECKGPSNFDCISCKNQYLYTYNEGSTCVSACPSSTFIFNNTCTKCSSNCIDCIDSSTCLKCKNPYFLYLSSCSSTCGLGNIPSINTCCILTSFLNHPLSQQSIILNSLPTFQINIETQNTLSLQFSCSPEISLGSVSIYQNKSLIQSIHSTSFFSLNNSIFIPLSSTKFNYSETYSLQIDPKTFNFKGSGNTELPLGILKFFVLKPKLRDFVSVINNNTLGEEVKVNENIVLDASKSFDPSEEIRSGLLQKWWSCVDLTEKFREYLKIPEGNWRSFVFGVGNEELAKTACGFWDYTKEVSDSIVVIEKAFGVNSVFLFTFSMTDGSRRSESWVLIRIIPETYTQAYVLDKPILKVNPDKKLFFSVEQSQGLQENNIFWSIYSDANIPVFITPLYYSWVLGIAENSLIPQAKYSISLNYAESVSVTSDIFYIEINQPPQNGSFLFDDSEKIAIISYFTGSLVDWEDSDLPLKFSFFVYEENFQVFRPVQAFSYSNSAYFPLSSGKIWVKGLVSDALGAISYETVGMNVLPQESFERIVGKAEESLEDFLNGELFSSISDFSTIFVELNKFSEGILTLKENLIEKIGDFFLRCKETDVETRIFCFISIIECMLHSVQGVNSEKGVNSITNLFLQLNFSDFNSRQQINFESYIGDSIQSFLSPNEQENLSFTLLLVLELLFPISNLPISVLETFVQSQFSLLSPDFQPNESTKVIMTMNSSSFIQKVTPNSKYPSIQLSLLNITLPVLTSPIYSEYSFIGAVLSTNPFNTSSVLLNMVVDLTIFSEESNFFLSEPFFYSVEILKSDLKPIIITLDSNKLRPICVFFDKGLMEWSKDGCQLVSPQIIDIFKSPNKDYVQVSCLCTHLSMFSIEFKAVQTDPPSYSNIQKVSNQNFDFSDAKKSCVMYILIVFSFMFILGMLISGFVDYWRNDSEIAFFVFQDDTVYTKTQKVEIFLTGLHKDYQKIAEKGFIAMELVKIIKNPAFDQLTQNDSEDLRVFNIKKNSIVLPKRQKNYLESHSIGDKFFINRENNLLSIKSKLAEFDEDFKAESEIDQFLRRFGPEEKFLNFKKPLKKRHLNELKMEINDFFALGPTNSGEIIPVASKVSGGKYSNFYLAEILKKEAKNYDSQVHVPYFTLFFLILQKEHKVLAIFYSLSIEFTKKQLTCMLFLNIHLHLALFLNFFTFFPVNFGCTTSCFYQGEMFLSIFCSLLCWPVILLLKALFAKGMSGKQDSTKEQY